MITQLAHEVRLALFDSPYEYRMSSSKRGFNGRFTTQDGREFEMQISAGPRRVVFDADRAYVFAEAVFKDLHASDSTGMTGKGDQIRIFATVLDFIKRALKGLRTRRVVVDVLSFYAIGKSRISLYERMSKKLMRAMGFKKLRRVDANDMFWSASFYLMRDPSMDDELDGAGFFG